MFNRSCSGVGEYAFSSVQQLEATLHPEPSVWSALSHPVALGVIVTAVVCAKFYQANRMPDLRSAFSQFSVTQSFRNI